VNRRAFVAAGLAAAAAVRPGRAEDPGDPPKTETPKRPGPRTVKLPRSRFETPVIGLGCPYLARWSAQGKPEEVGRILRYAFDRGIRFFDSGQLYPVDPVAGTAIAEFCDKVYISNKTHAAGLDASALVSPARRDGPEELPHRRDRLREGAQRV
jgi:aryl-alcohol dehydrogenase-like predicted oxidoreductase